jgi:hypothetical protein
LKIPCAAASKQHKYAILFRKNSISRVWYSNGDLSGQNVRTATQKAAVQGSAGEHGGENEAFSGQENMI